VGLNWTTVLNGKQLRPGWDCFSFFQSGVFNLSGGHGCLRTHCAVSRSVCMWRRERPSFQKRVELKVMNDEIMSSR
jgi:hypothetical protein